MIALTGVWAFLRGPLMRGLAGLPRLVWYGLAMLLVLMIARRWHGNRLVAAYAKGASAQSRADMAEYAAAAAAAEQRQRALVAALNARQSEISKGSTDALRVRNDDLARRYADLRLRWAAYQADSSGAGESRAAAVSIASGGTEDAACAAGGWVAFDVAAASAQAADTAIAKDDAWIAWARAQAVAWPRG